MVTAKQMSVSLTISGGPNNRPMRLPGFMQKLLTSYFRFLAAGVVVLILTSGYVLLIRAKVDTLRTSGYLERANVARELQEEKAYLSQIRSAYKEFRRLLPAEKLAAIDEFIPTGTDFPGLLLTIRNIATAANLDLATMAISQTATVANIPPSDRSTTGGENSAQAATVSGLVLRTQDVTVSVRRGQNYETFKRFIALIESSRRLFDVVSLGFSHEAQAADSGSTYSLVLRSYYLPAAGSPL